jgi:hypothetical protein
MINVMHKTHHTKNAVREASLVAKTTKQSDRMRSQHGSRVSICPKGKMGQSAHELRGARNTRSEIGTQSTQAQGERRKGKEERGKKKRLTPWYSNWRRRDRSLLRCISDLNEAMKNDEIYDQTVIQKEGRELYSTEQSFYKKQCKEAAAMAVIRAKDNVDRAPNKQQRQSG